MLFAIVNSKLKGVGTLLKRLVHAVVRRRHPWRKMRFDELAEIYTSMSLRSFGFGIIGIFVPVYLYTSGVSLQGVFLFYTLFFAMRVPTTFVASYIVGRIGPKHTIAVSTVIIIVFLAMLLSYDAVGWPLFFLAFVFDSSNSLFFLAYNTDFSKVKDSKHGGKELGWLYVFERIGKALGPIAGGLLAGIVAPEATLVFAILVLMLSLVPLFLTNEPVKAHQRVSFKGFRVRDHARDYLSVGAFNMQNVANMVFWPLLLAVFIFQDNTYTKLGTLVGITMGISIFSAHMFGKFIDNRRGVYLLRYGVLMNVVLSASRAAITGTGGAVAVSVLGEPVILSYRMPLIKGLYDEADGADGYRIVYLAWAEIIAGSTKFSYSFGLLIASQYFDPISVIRVSFLVIPVIGLASLAQRFPALKT